MFRSDSGRRLSLLACLGVLLFTPVLGPLHSPATADEEAAAEVPVRPARSPSGTLLVHGAGNAEPLDDAALADLRTYAAANGENARAVVRAHEGIAEFSDLVTALEANSSSYVRSGLADAGAPGDYWIQFTDLPNADVIARVGALPVDVEIQYGVPATSRELATLAAALTKSLSGRPDVIGSARTRYDSDRRVLQLSYSRVPGSSDELVEAVLHDALLAGTVDGELPLPVALEATSAMRWEE